MSSRECLAAPEHPDRLLGTPGVQIAQLRLPRSIPAVVVADELRHSLSLLEWAISHFTPNESVNDPK